MSQQYTEQEAEAILRLAVQKSGETISKDRLRAMASELGVSPNDLAQAEQAFFDDLAGKEEKKALLVEKARRSLGLVLAWSVASFLMLVVSTAEWFLGHNRITWAAFGIAALTLFVVFRLRRILTAAHSADLRRRKRTPIDAEVREALNEIALREPTKIEAIQQLRNRLGLSLRDAKDSVDEYDRQNGSVFTHRR